MDLGKIPVLQSFAILILVLTWWLIYELNPKSTTMNYLEIIEKVKKRNPNEPEFIQAAEEVILSVALALEKNPEYVRLKLQIGRAHV